MLSCDSGTECHLVPDDPTDDHTREAKCMCSNNCPDDFVPICGSNGKTVSNAHALIVSERDKRRVFEYDKDKAVKVCSLNV